MYVAVCAAVGVFLQNMSIENKNTVTRTVTAIRQQFDLLDRSEGKHVPDAPLLFLMLTGTLVFGAKSTLFCVKNTAPPPM
jgi:hypothetical protein